MTDFSLLVSPGGESLLVSLGGLDFNWAPDGTIATGGGASFRIPTKRRFAVRDGETIKVFEKLSDAIAATAANDEPEAAEPEVIEVKRPPRKSRLVQTVDLAAMAEQARQMDMLKQWQAAQRANQIAAMLAIAERIEDESEVELLLMYA